MNIFTNLQTNEQANEQVNEFFDISFMNEGFNFIAIVKDKLKFDLSNNSWNLDYKEVYDQFKTNIQGNKEEISWNIEQKYNDYINYYFGLSQIKGMHLNLGINYNQGFDSNKQIVNCNGTFQMDNQFQWTLQYIFNYRQKEQYNCFVRFKYISNLNKSNYTILCQALERDVFCGITNEYMLLSYKYKYKQYSFNPTYIYHFKHKQRILLAFKWKIMEQLETLSAISNYELFQKIDFKLGWLNFGYSFHYSNQLKQGLHLKICI